LAMKNTSRMRIKRRGNHQAKQSDEQSKGAQTREG
jgi:hypothetical protein